MSINHHKPTLKRTLTIVAEENKPLIKPARNVPGRKPLDNPLPLKYPVYPNTPTPSPDKEPTPSNPPTPNSCSSYVYELSNKSFELKEVKGESILIKYKFLSCERLEGIFDWNNPLPSIPLMLEMKVGRTTTLIELPTEFMERKDSSNSNSNSNKTTITKLRRATEKVNDIRGYVDTYILNHWSSNDVCFYLRTLILNYLVDSHPLSESSNTYHGIVWKYELLSRERLSKIREEEFYLSSNDLLKLERIRNLELEIGTF